MAKRYLVEFQNPDPACNLAGFDVCLAISALELPLDVVIHPPCDYLLLKLSSLKEYGMAYIYTKTSLTDIQYKQLTHNAHFFLMF